jgi:adenosylcobyric acid synthase
MGNTLLGADASPAFEITKRNNRAERVADGAIDREGRIMGTYIHGIFDNDDFRKSFLQHLRRRKGICHTAATGRSNAEAKEKAFQRLARTVRDSLDMKELYRILQRGLD